MTLATQALHALDSAAKQSNDMGENMTKIAIHGAGAIGCFVGGVWAASGLEVTLIGRDYVGDTIKANGMQLTDYEGYSARLAVEDIKFSNSPTALAEADIIALSVKSTGTRAAAAEIAAHAKKGAIVLSLQNGVSNADILRELVPEQTVLAGMVPFNVVSMEGARWHKGTLGILMAQSHPALEPVAEATAGSPAALKLMDDMVAVSWGKLLLNLNNAVNALSGETLLKELSNRDYRRVVAASMREALATLEAAGIEPAKVAAFPPKFLPKFIGAPNFLFNTIGLRMQKVDAHARSSMADDFAAGRPTEIDFLNGEVVRLAEEKGLDAPINSRIVELVKAAETGGRKNWPGADLRREVLGR